MFNRISQLGLLLCLAAGVAAAQKDKMPPPTPKPAPTSKPNKSVTVKVPEPPRAPRWDRFDGVTSEKAIPVDPNVEVRLCVSHGDLKVNGSERNEVRVFVRNGRKFELRPLERVAGKASWIELTRATGTTPLVGQFANCLSGESIEIDLPMSGSLTIKGRSATVSIDSVKKAAVDIVAGDLTIRNVSGGLLAKTEQGELVAESVSGDIGLETTGGNILAFDLKSSKASEMLKVKTLNGTVSLQKIGHRQIDVSATSGHVKYVGGFAGGGIYKFRSGWGRIGLLLPADVDCKVSANYGFGRFDSSFTMKILTETTSEGGKSLVGQLGAGKGPVIQLETTRGSIAIHKQGELELP